jgi:putative phosphoesterase
VRSVSASGPKAPTGKTKGSSRRSYRVGILSDTHGLLRPALVEALAGVDLIVHAGDIDEPTVLDRLGAIAPVTAVRGNMDRGRWAARLHRTEVIEIGAVTLYALHDLEQLALDPAAAGFNAVISGHTHQPALKEHNGVLYVNPGSAGRQRGGLPATAALMDINRRRVQVRFVEFFE